MPDISGRRPRVRNGCGAKSAAAFPRTFRLPVCQGSRARSSSGSPRCIPKRSATQLQLLMVESKTRKSVFLREAVRALDLPGAEVATARFEELLARPDLHESHDLVSIRAVRVESRVLMGLQAFVKPGGLLFLFR